MIPEAKTDGNIWICLFSLRLIVKKEKPMAEITADKFPFQSPAPKSPQIIIKTPVKAMAMDSNVLIDIVSFRNIGIFHEHVTNKILDDLIKACEPKHIEVFGDFKPRGGIKTTVKSKK